MKNMCFCHSIAMTSWWPRWRLQSPASRLFTQSFIQTQMKENIKAPRHWPLCGEFTGTGDFPVQRASDAENVSIWWRHHGTWISYGRQMFEQHRVAYVTVLPSRGFPNAYLLPRDNRLILFTLNASLVHNLSSEVTWNRPRPMRRRGYMCHVFVYWLGCSRFVTDRPPFLESRQDANFRCHWVVAPMVSQRQPPLPAPIKLASLGFVVFSVWTKNGPVHRRIYQPPLS